MYSCQPQNGPAGTDTDGYIVQKAQARPTQLRIRVGAGRVQEGGSGNNPPTDRRRAHYLLPGRDDPQAGICIRLGIDTSGQ